jgi:hypothetical protein
MQLGKIIDILKYMKGQLILVRIIILDEAKKRVHIQVLTISVLQMDATYARSKKRQNYRKHS